MRTDVTDPEDFRAVLDLNVVAPLVSLQAVLPVLRAQGGGSVVDVSSGTSRTVLRAGALRQRPGGPPPRTAEQVADALLRLVESGEEEAVLVPGGPGGRTAS
ncbi:SDR family oxidoreductase [Kineococcus arenarius]|uniref:hypothetical protein n=1 Tax=unclassified Kineococcus TaxID=2621656 RepID=UPI003D7E26BA